MGLLRGKCATVNAILSTRGSKETAVKNLKSGSNERVLDVTNLSSSPSSSSDSISGNSSFSDNTNVGEGKKDISRHYSNVDLGIIDFVIPQGWYGSESFDPDKLFRGKSATGYQPGKIG
jgi:hypothetical protein